MRKLALLAFLLGATIQLTAQNTDAGLSGKDLYENARTYLQKGDYANAIMVYNQAIQVEPKNLIYRRELAHAYFLQGDMTHAEAMVKPLLKAEESDPETYLVACKIYMKMNNSEEAKTAINNGIEKFPKQGELYEQKGQLYTSLKNYKEAAEVWEKGIEKDPAYYMNYYNLTKSYYFNKQYLWAIIYAEHFVTMESFSSRSEEMKKMMFESYKFLFAELNNLEIKKKSTKAPKEPDTFNECYLQVLDNLKNTVTGGVTTENLTMLRVRFLLEWNKNYAKSFPMELIDYQQRMILNGFFDAYNTWLFGRLENENSVKNWTQKNAVLMNSFDKYFRANKLQPKLDQYYHH